MAVSRYKKKSKSLALRHPPEFVPPTARQAERLWPDRPAAFDLGERYRDILQMLKAHPRRYLTRHASSKILKTSQRTLDHWEKQGILVRDPLTKKYFTGHLIAFARAMWDLGGGMVSIPYREERFGPPRQRFGRLRAARFDWPKTEKRITPAALAKKVGCHVSTIYRAIEEDAIPARRRTSHRWEILRVTWKRAFPASIA